MENAVPAVICFGIWSSAACVATVASTPANVNVRTPNVRTCARFISGVIADGVMVTRDVGVMHSGSHVWRQVYGETHRRLRQQGLVKVSRGDPDDFAFVVVEGRERLGDVDGLAALVDELSAQNILAHG